MSAQNKEIFSTFAEVAAPVQADSETDDALETLTYIAFLLEGIKSVLEVPASNAATAGAKSGSTPAAISKKESPTQGGFPKSPRRPAHDLATRKQEARRSPSTRTDDTKAMVDAPRMASGADPQAGRRPRNQATTVASSPQVSIFPLPAISTKEPRPSASRRSEQENSAVKSKSQVQLEEEQQKSTEQKQGGLLDALKRNLSEWDGTASGGQDGNLQEAAGMAVDGPLFAAVKDIARLVETDDNDDKSLLSVLRKTVEDKTGITAAKDWAAQKKENLIGTIRGWGNNGQREPVNQPNNRPVAAQVGEVTRDAQGLFLPKKNRKVKLPPPLPTDEEKQQVELTEALVTIQTKEAKLSDQRHEEIIKAICKTSGGGLLGKAKGAVDWLRGRRQSRAESASGGRQGVCASSALA